MPSVIQSALYIALLPSALIAQSLPDLMTAHPRRFDATAVINEVWCDGQKFSMRVKTEKAFGYGRLLYIKAGHMKTSASELAKISTMINENERVTNGYFTECLGQDGVAALVVLTYNPNFRNQVRHLKFVVSPKSRVDQLVIKEVRTRDR